MEAGNMFTVKLVNSEITSKSDLPSGTIVKVTNTDKESGWNEYEKDAFEDDGSLIVVFRVKSRNSVLNVKVSWSSGSETTYSFDFSDSVLESAGQ